MTAPPPSVPTGELRPGQVTAIAYLTLINGVLNIIWSGVLGIGFLVTIVGLLCSPFALYGFVLGVLEIVYAARLLSSRAGTVKPARYLAVMQICDIIIGNVIAFVVGILALVFYGQPAVLAYFGEGTGPGSTSSLPA